MVNTESMTTEELKQYAKTATAAARRVHGVDTRETLAVWRLRRDTYIRALNDRLKGRGGETDWLTIQNVTGLSRSTIERIAKGS